MGVLKRDPNCTRCRLHQAAQFVCLLGHGPKSCDIMIIGEAPGEREDDSGKPFVGRAGQYLDEVLEDMELPREEVFITNAVSCRPPDNRTPSKAEIRACRYWLQAQIDQVKPRYVMLLGNVPLFAITERTGIKKARGKPFKKDGIWFIPTYHPSYILRNDRRDDAIFRQDFELLKEIRRSGRVPQEENLNIRVVTEERHWREMLKDLIGQVSFDLETSGLYPWEKDYKITSVGFGTRRHQWIFRPDDFDFSKKRQRELAEILDDCYVIAHNGKFDALCMWVIYQMRVRIDFDTMIAHYLIDENSPHDLKGLAQRFCNAPNWDVEGEIKKGVNPTPAEKQRQIKYHAHDLYYTRNLKFIFARDLGCDEQVLDVFRYIMMPCVQVFTGIEYDGATVNVGELDTVGVHLKKKIAQTRNQLNRTLRRELRHSTPRNVNWGSPKQVADILYNQLRITPPVVIGRKKKGKTGNTPSTAEPVLKQIDHPLVKDLLDFRGAKQQLSFFIEGWRPFLVNGRIHPSFKLTGTVTGRLSAEHPNLQQIPRDALIRSLITAPEGWVLIEADLSQIELRIAAELAGERALIEAFATGKDPHWMTALNELRRGHGEFKRVLETASKITGKKISDYDEAIDILWNTGADRAIEVDGAWKELRKKAKAVNFGYLYGMGWKKFKQYAREKYDVILTDEQAQESRSSFFELYRDLPDWHDRQRRFARRNGYVRSLSGRKRRVPAAMRNDRSPEAGEAERQAINSPVQSFANELNLMALIQLREEFSRSVYRPVGTVHDAILAIVREDWVERVAKRTTEVMSHPKLLDTLDIKLSIPIEADLKIGPWGKGVKLSKWLETHSMSANPRSASGDAAGTRRTFATSKNSGASSRRDRSVSAA